MANPRPPAEAERLATAALAAAERGWAVFPCRQGDKRPCIEQWGERASSDRVHIGAAWRGRWARSNIGVACAPSRLVVIDLDTPTRGSQLPPQWAAEPNVRDGLGVLAALAKRAGQRLPKTYAVRTPSGGLHLYFAAPGSREIRNSAGRIGPMVDVRGAGGYIVGAGSAVRGRIYQVVRDCEPAPLPRWLAELAAPAPPLPPVPMPGPAPELYRRLHGVVATLLDAGPGDRRNARLFWAACRAGEMVAAGQLGAAAAELVLYRAAELNGHVAKHGERATRATIASGMRQGTP
jgi:Bifunctional DNA primase/polymerase, N-terminal